VAAVQHRLVFESFGVVTEVLAEDPALLERLPRVLPPGWQLAEGGGEPSLRLQVAGDGTISLNGARLARAAGDRTGPLARLGPLIRHQLALNAPRHVFIHAGVVCANERAIVIPGKSYTGKTTLVAALVDAGATYYSDEYAVVEPRGMIEPYAKPLSVRRDGIVEPGRPVPVAAGQIARGPVRAGLIVITRYERGARWQPARRTSGEGAVALLANTVVARPRPRQSLAAVSELARGAEVIEGVRGDAREAALSLLSMVI
jgi:hypothetical protein